MGAFKGWQSTRKNKLFAGFPNIITPSSRMAYGFKNPSLFLDAGYNVSSFVNSAALDFWKDRFSNQSNFAAAGGARPLWIASDAGYNNNPVISFSTSQRFTASTEIQFKTIVFVGNYAAVNSAYNALLINDGFYNVSLGGLRSNFNSCGIFKDQNPTTIYIQGTTEDTTVKICAMSQSAVYINGVNEFTGAWNNELNQSFKYLGGHPSYSTTHLNGKVAQLILFPYLFSDGDLLRISDELNAIYQRY